MNSHLRRLVEPIPELVEAILGQDLGSSIIEPVCELC
jgi:hypothetical protein